MKVIIAPNAFKGTILAGEAAAAIAEGVRRVMPTADVVEVPVSDGGDGSLATFLDIFDGIYRSSVVCGPLGEPVEADWGIINEGHTAFIETALAFGLALVPDNRRDPSITTSRGVGELIISALDIGLRDFIIAVGGSANNDGGKGMLHALGARFLDCEGHVLEEGGLSLQYLDRIDIDNLDQRIMKSNILVLSDSSVPLTGETGVSIMYSPGKGATREMALALDAALVRYAKVIQEQFAINVEQMPSAGSGGGVVCAAEVFLKADRSYGIDVVLDKLKFNAHLENASLVVTGEGQVDEQTIYNKAPIGVAKAAKQAGVPVLAICALLGDGYEKVFEHGIDTVAVVSGKKGWCDTGKIVDEELLSIAAEDIFRQLKNSGVSSIHKGMQFFRTENR
ncbi:glycerate kinase [bacterium]|nr:glycerate kinase [bacterium]